MRRLLVFAFFSGLALSQGEAGRWTPMLDRLGDRAEPPPPLSEIFRDVATMVREADASAARPLTARLREIEDEIRLLEDLRRTNQRGILIQLPPEVGDSRAMLDGEISEAVLEREQRRLEGLKADLQLAQMRRDHGPGLHREPGEMALAKGLSRFGRAMMAVEVVVPVPPAIDAGAPQEKAPEVDAAGLAKALYLAGDHAGALKAIDEIPEGARDLETVYRRARCLERLERRQEANEAYRKVATAEPESFWGKQAAWMLEFGKHKYGALDILGRRVNPRASEEDQ